VRLSTLLDDSGFYLASSTSGSEETLSCLSLTLCPQYLAEINVICKARAIHDYDPIGGDGQDLRFRAGDIITVIKKVCSLNRSFLSSHYSA